MIRKVTQEGFDLTQKGIQQISEEISTILADAQIDSKEILQMRLLSEETLLKYKDSFEENTEVSIRFSEFFGSIKLTLCIRCDSYDPFYVEEDAVNGLMRSMLVNTKSIDQLWRHRDGVNYIQFTLIKRKKVGQLSRIMIGILCGFAGGFLINAVVPGHVELISEKILVPLTDTFTGLLCVMATVMCFGAISLGTVLFRPGYCIVFTSCCLFAADLYGVPVTWGWLLAAFLMSFVLSVATPPVIGGTTVCFSILFSQLGIGAQALAMIISVNAVLEFMTVAVNNYCLESQITLLAGSLEKLDRNRLRKA